MRKIILFGGSFDPIHNGHIDMARRAKEAINADEVIFILAKNPRWKSPTSDVQARLDMLRLAVQKVNGFSISLYEVDSDAAINYTIDTVKHFRDVYPNAELYDLIGFDEVALFPQWKDAEELTKIVHLLDYGRTNFPLDKEIVTQYQMTLVEGPVNDAASNQIRELKQAKTPVEVLDYIAQNGLYYMKTIRRYINGRRLEHSLSVARLAYSIAEHNGLDASRAYIAGILHDIGKEESHAEKMELLKAYYSNPEELPTFSYHQFAGALIAEKEFGISDPEIIDAIRYHATGKADMKPLGMIIYAADKIEPTRGFDSKALIESCLADYKQGFLNVLQANRDFLIGKKKDIYNPLTQACMSMYLGEHQ